MKSAPEKKTKNKKKHLREARKREGLEHYFGWLGNAALRKHWRRGLEESKATNCVDICWGGWELGGAALSNVLR